MSQDLELEDVLNFMERGLGGNVRIPRFNSLSFTPPNHTNRGENACSGRSVDAPLQENTLGTFSKREQQKRSNEHPKK